MKKIYLFMTIIVTLLGCGNNETFKDGDIIFHTSKSSQSKMIQDVTESKYSHVGIIYIKDGQTYVLEAIQPVKITPLNEFINRGLDSKYTVVRYNKDLSENQLKRMFEYGYSQLGKNYDLKFEWSEDKMYCSELVYKIYESAGIKLCGINKFSDYDISSDEVQNEINLRYKTKININEPVVTPVDLYKTLSVHTIYSNY
jgi:uncharacterized protein YycO